MHEMSAQDVVDFYSNVENMGIDIWIEGGWGVDALLGKQTRTHGDLDIIVQQKDVEVIKKYLEDKGYKIIHRNDLTDINFHLGDEHGHEIDFTVIEFDEKGNGIYGLRENDEMILADSFKGHGVIHGHKVKCISPESAVLFRTGYKPRDIDYHDVKLLCEKFSLELPNEYEVFNQTKTKPTVYMLCGLTGSGKTHYAKELEAKGYIRLALDEEVHALVEKNGYAYPDKYLEFEPEAKENLEEKLKNLIQEDKNTILDYGFWKKSDRDKYKKLIEDNGGTWKLIYFKANPELLAARLDKRNERTDANSLSVTPTMLEDFIKRFEEPKDEDEEAVIQN